MAIAFDAAASGATNSGVSSLTYSHTCTGSNLSLTVFVDYQAADLTITGATYNGVAMSVYFPDTLYNSARKWAFFHLEGPSTGANNIVVSMSGTTTQRLGACSVSHTGAAQSGQPDSSNSDTTVRSVTSYSHSTTVVAANCWLIGSTFSGNLPTAGAGTTIRTTEPSPFDDPIRLSDSNGTVGTGSQSLAWTQTPANQFAGFIVSLKPFVAPVINGNFLMLM